MMIVPYNRFANHFSAVNSGIVFACPLFTGAVFGSLIVVSEAV